MARRIAVSLALAVSAVCAEPLGVEWTSVPGATSYEMQIAAVGLPPVWGATQEFDADVICSDVCHVTIDVPTEIGDPFLGRVRAVQLEPSSVSPWSTALLPRSTLAPPSFLRRATILLSVDFGPTGEISDWHADLIGLDVEVAP